MPDAVALTAGVALAVVLYQSLVPDDTTRVWVLNRRLRVEDVPWGAGAGNPQTVPAGTGEVTPSPDPGYAAV